MSMEY